MLGTRKMAQQMKILSTQKQKSDILNSHPGTHINQAGGEN